MQPKLLKIYIHILRSWRPIKDPILNNNMLLIARSFVILTHVVIDYILDDILSTCGLDVGS